MKHILVFLFFSSSAMAAKPATIKWQPNNKQSSQEVQFPVEPKPLTDVCTLNGERYAVNSEGDQAECMKKGGSVHRTMEDTSKYQHVDGAPLANTAQKRVNEMMTPPARILLDQDAKVRGAVHYDPLEEQR